MFNKKSKSFYSCIALLLTIIFIFPSNIIRASTKNSNLNEDIEYSINGTDIIERMSFDDTDGSRVTMLRTIHKDGTANVSISKNNKTDYLMLGNHDYNLFYQLANFESNTNTIGNSTLCNDIFESNFATLSGGSDLIGSQYKHIYIASNSTTVYNDAVTQILIGGASTATGILMTVFSLPGGILLSLGSFLYTVIAALSPYKVVIDSSVYEVHFSYDDVYYTHCYHNTVKTYDTGNHLIETRTEYYQAIGG